MSRCDNFLYEVQSMHNENSIDNKEKMQSNPFSTGGGGVNFETRVRRCS